MAVLLLHGSGTQAGWTDARTIGGTPVVSARVVAPTISCGARSVDGVVVSWQAVPNATAYRLYLDGLPLFRVDGSARQVLVVAPTGVVTVRALFGEPGWVSEDSNPKRLPALLGETCS